MANDYVNAVDLVFSCACSGDNIFRHNLTLVKDAGNAWIIEGRPMEGDVYIKTIAAATITIHSVTATAKIRVVMNRCADFS